MGAGAPVGWDEGELEEAGRAAVAGRSADELRTIVREALRTQPPRVAAHELRAWRAADLLDGDDPHAWWLDAACRATAGSPPADALDRYEQARAVFAERGDVQAEVSVGMAAAIVARRLDDLGTIVRFLFRAAELAAAGVTEVQGPAKLGEALAAQMGGDPAGALALLEQLAPDGFEDDWAAQVAMVRGTNLMLLGRFGEATIHLQSATTTGGPWSHAVALELLASARWSDGDRVGAIRDLEAAEATAGPLGADALVAMARALRAAMLAADGDPDAGALIASLRAAPTGDPEVLRLVRVAEVLGAVSAGDLAGARARAEALELADRPVRSTVWTASLQTALVPGAAERWAAAVESGQSSLSAALAAGRAAAGHLAGGPRAPRSDRPLLPAAWCEPAPPVVEVRLLGGAVVLLDRRPTDHRSWERARVRELCLYLALVADSSRDLAADRLWPALSSDAAAKNLRVTLSYLLDVLDPGRERGAGSDLVVDRAGVLALATGPRLSIDVRDQDRMMREVLEAAAVRDRAGVLGAARRLVRLPRGPLLGGAALGPWVEPIIRERRDLLLRAAAAAGPTALRAGDTDLAEALARRGLDEDPWAERLHQLMVRAALARDDLDGARRSVRDALAALDELGAEPEPATLDLARQVGLRRS
jgi:DNA-binding SARP family transcriptional activator